MAKVKKQFICSVCGQLEGQWQGRCRGCHSWNSFYEENTDYTSTLLRERSTNLLNRENSKAVYIAEVPLPQIQRISSSFSELDRVLGGGLVPSSVIMLGGEPGIGKSTLLLQMAARLEQQNVSVLYISAEESALQLKIRARRLGLENSQFSLLCSNDLNSIVTEIHRYTDKTPTKNHQEKLLIIDSLQTVLDPGQGSIPGTPSQLRRITQVLQDCSREYKWTIILVAHLTKDGVIAGPRTVEHMVDCVIYFEHGEHDLRILQANKNRFGSTSELGILQMSEDGLKELESPQQYFLSQRTGPMPAGIAIAPVHEGSRSLLVEVQALTVPAKGSVSRIFADRLDNARLSRIAAVLERHTEVVFSNQDIYVNIAGGLRLQDIALDLPLALALLSARLNRPLPKRLISAGELSLAGELRPIKHEELRLRSAIELGIQELVFPVISSKKQKNEPIDNRLKVIRLGQIEEVLQFIFYQLRPEGSL